MLLKSKYFRQFIFSFIAIIVIAIYNPSYLNRVLQVCLVAFLFSIISDLAFQNKKFRDFSLLQKISLFVMVVGIFILVFSSVKYSY
ncbi:putative neutral ceramidase superfamily lipid hydrolase [Lysinibacillus sp. RC79]